MTVFWMLVDQLKGHEGYRKFPYKCTAGALTVGYGHNLDANGITEQQATDLLKDDVHAVLQELHNYSFFTQLDPVRQCVIGNMAFCLGIAGLFGFRRMLAAIRLRQYDVAANEILNSKFARQTGNRAIELADLMRRGS